VITFKLTGSARELIFERAWAYRPDLPEGPVGHATYRAVMDAPWVKAGFGRRYTVTTSREGAIMLLSYLESLAALKGIGDLDVGDSFNTEANIAAAAARSVRKALA